MAQRLELVDVVRPALAGEFEGGLRLQLVDHLQRVVLAVQVVVASVDPPVVAHSDQLFALVPVLRRQHHVLHCLR